MKTINLKTAILQITIITGTILSVLSCSENVKPEATKKIARSEEILLYKNQEPAALKEETVTETETETNQVDIVSKKSLSKSEMGFYKKDDNDKISITHQDSAFAFENFYGTTFEVNPEACNEPEVSFLTEQAQIFEPKEIIKPNMILEKVCWGVNSESSEMGAIISPDGKTLYFSRSNYPQNVGGKNDDEDIWYANWDEANNKWGEAKNIGAPLNNKYPNFINSISPDGNTLLLGNIYCTNGDMQPGLSLSNRTENGWDFPKEIIFEGDKMQPRVSACQLSSDQKTLFLAYQQRKNSYGKEDIYVSFLQSNKQWSKPINLGATVNTKGKETAPFLAADGITLYFTTDGQNGYGGEDIYVTTRLDETWQNWSAPKNMGPKVNTNYNQTFFSCSNNKIYFSSEIDTRGNLDLFTFITPEAPTIKLETPVATSEINEKANYNCNQLSVPSLNADLTLSTIFFDSDKCELSKGTIEELQQIAEKLLESPTLQIEIAGRADNVGAEEYNYNLSQKRLDAVFNYLKYKVNVNENQITVKNYGETKPIGDNSSIVGRQLNRSVELLVKTNSLAGN